MTEPTPVGPHEALRVEIALTEDKALAARLQHILDALPDPEFMVAYNQAVDFALYVESHAKGGMKDAARLFLSNEYAQKIKEERGL